MAAITRRTWANLRDEAIIALGGYDYTGFSGRVEHALYAAYLDIGLGWHHYELGAISSATVATNDISLSVPATAFVVMSVNRSPNNAGNALTLERLHFLVANFSATAAVPKKYARSGASALLLLDCPCNAASAGSWTIRFYKVPTAPDFAGSGTPETHWLWDDHILELAIAKMQRKVWRPDLAALSTQSLENWLSQQIQPDLVSEVIASLPDYPTASRPHGAAQG